MHAKHDEHDDHDEQDEQDELNERAMNHEETAAFLSDEDADSYRRAQAAEMHLRFEQTHGRPPRDDDELAHFLREEEAAGRLAPGPIAPSPDAYARAHRSHLN